METLPLNEDPMGGFLLPLSMFLLMLGMGIALTTEDFRRIVRVPAPVVAGTLIQLVAMPAAAFAIALAFDLPTMLAAGLVVAGACPGGMGSNVMVHYARANTALSITLTATATTATLITMPLWIRGILGASGGGEAATVEVPLLSTAVDLGGLTVVPVALGMALRAQRPSVTRLERPLTALGGLGVFGTLGYAAAVRPDPPVAELELSFAPTIVLLVASLILGLGIPALLRQTLDDIVTLGIEICLKNGLLGMVVVSGTFGLLEPNVPIIVYTSLMIPICIGLLVFNRWYQARSRTNGAASIA